MRRVTPERQASTPAVRVRRGYFECRFGQLHVHNSIPPGGGFEEGTPLLCLHDWRGSGRVFARFLALAGEDRSVYAPDLPGFGESDPPPATAAVGDFAAAIGDFIDSMRLRNLDVLGVRGGAQIATELALARPAQIARLVLASLPLLTEAERQAGERERQRVAAIDGAAAPADWQPLAIQAAPYPLRERLGRVTQRLLVLRVRDDLWDATGRVREVLPGARLVEQEVGGSDPFGSGAARTAAVMREFLRG